MKEALLEFDRPQAELAKRRGMDDAAAARADRLAYARRIAREIAEARADRCVTADDVQARVIAETGEVLSNEAGSIFVKSQWRFTGRWKPSERVSNHGHSNRVWELR